MEKASAENRQLAKTVARAFGGGRPDVRRYWDADESHHIDITQVSETPSRGVTSYGTLGLSDYPLMDNGREYPARCELVGACASTYERFDNIISTCAFNIIKDQEFAYAGRIFPEVVTMYYPSLQMRHVMFTKPFLWEDELQSVELPGKTVAWLLAVPVSHAEMQYARSSGPNALEDVFVREQIDIFDLGRPSVIKP
jgi:antitoxin YqcF